MKTANFPIELYNKIRLKNLYWSDYICFCEVSKEGKKLSRETTRRWFLKLVNKDDYAQNERKQILDFVCSLR